MKILAIDTSTEACSAALYSDCVITKCYQFAPRQHASLILNMVDKLLSDSGLSLSQLDALAFARGPGAFTGVRIATSVIHGLALSADHPVIAISTLATLAQGAILTSKQVACAIDARMGEVYWALYKADDNDLMRLFDKESVCAPDAIKVVTEEGSWFGIGSGWNSYTTILHNKMGTSLAGYSSDVYPAAEHICPLAVDAYKCGNILDVTHALPIYLRDNVIG